MNNNNKGHKLLFSSASHSGEVGGLVQRRADSKAASLIKTAGG